jgi:hypothetical protein
MRADWKLKSADYLKVSFVRRVEGFIKSLKVCIPYFAFSSLNAK